MKIDRLMAITLYMLNRDTVSAAALAKRFEVSRRTIQRDMDVLCQAGLPLVATHGPEGGYAIMDGFKVIKQMAGVDDYLNLVTALKGLSSAYDSKGLHETLDKTLAALPEGEQRLFVDFSVAQAGKATKAYLQAMDEAIAKKVLLKIGYSDAQGKITKRIIEPLALSFQWYAWYVFAYCAHKQAYRLFKLPRIMGCEPVPGAFSKNHGDVEALMKAHGSQDERPYILVRLKCKQAIRQQALEYLGTNIVEEDVNDFVLELTKVPLERMWFSLLLGFGNQVEVLAPQALRDQLRAKAAEVLSLYPMATC